MIYGIAIWGGGNITNLNIVSRINRTAVNIFINELPFSIPQPLTFNLVYQYFCYYHFIGTQIGNIFYIFTTKFSILFSFTVIALDFHLPIITPYQLFQKLLAKINFCLMQLKCEIMFPQK